MQHYELLGDRFSQQFMFVEYDVVSIQIEDYAQKP